VAALKDMSGRTVNFVGVQCEVKNEQEGIWRGNAQLPKAKPEEAGTAACVANNACSLGEDGKGKQQIQAKQFPNVGHTQQLSAAHMSAAIPDGVDV
jgi:hypothetical protein